MNIEAAMTVEYGNIIKRIERGGGKGEGTEEGRGGRRYGTCNSRSITTTTRGDGIFTSRARRHQIPIDRKSCRGK